MLSSLLQQLIYFAAFILIGKVLNTLSILEMPLEKIAKKIVMYTWIITEETYYEKKMNSCTKLAENSTNTKIFCKLTTDKHSPFFQCIFFLTKSLNTQKNVIHRKNDSTAFFIRFKLEFASLIEKKGFFHM